jgi:AcrR family transcriptional regulator
MKSALKDQKQEVVREALYDAAINIFAKNGFEETTVEEVTQAAGVSRRTFFRYFDSKDDLLAYAMVNYTKALAEAVEACPAGYTPFRVLHETVLAGLRYTSTSESRLRQVILISSRSASARQAYQSRMMDVQETLAGAFATHFHDTLTYDLRPHLLASTTLMVMNASIISWFQGQHKDLASAAKDVLSKVQDILCPGSPDRIVPAPVAQSDRRVAEPRNAPKRRSKKPR